MIGRQRGVAAELPPSEIILPSTMGELISAGAAATSNAAGAGAS